MAPNGTFIKVAEVLNIGLNNRVSLWSSHLSYRACFDVCGAVIHVQTVRKQGIGLHLDKMISYCVMSCSGGWSNAASSSEIGTR